MGKWNHENNGRLQIWTSSHLSRIHWEIFKGKRRNTKKFEAWKSGETRKKLSRLKDKSESLSGQVKRMTNKTKTTRRIPSPYNWKSLAESSEEDADSDPAELKVQEGLSENVEKEIKESPGTITKTKLLGGQKKLILQKIKYNEN